MTSLLCISREISGTEIQEYACNNKPRYRISDLCNMNIETIKANKSM